MADVFVYGTLTDERRVDEVLEEYSFVGPATLHGWHRVEGEYPTLAPGGTTDGRLLRTPDIAALDAYEGVDRGLYVRVSLPRADGDGAVEIYVGHPDRLGVDVAWPGVGAFAARVRATVERADVRVAVE